MPEPKEVVLTYVDAFNKGDLEVLCSLFTTNVPFGACWDGVPWKRFFPPGKDY